jgi:aldehyde:ferredoxin oxidoreductase
MEDGRQLLGDPAYKVPKVARNDYQAKGPLYALGMANFQLFNSSGMCVFSMFGTSVPVAKYVSAVNGWDLSPAEGLVAGRRIQALRQAFNLREGLSPEGFSLPARISEAPSTGPYAGDAHDFTTLRSVYFSAMNWDPVTGKPYPNELARLGLDFLIEDLWDESEGIVL